jgi:hypothetical protein
VQRRFAQRSAKWPPPIRALCDTRRVNYDDLMGMDAKYKLLILATFVLALIVIYQRSTKVSNAPSDELRLKVRYDGMLESIEIVAARILREYPNDDDLTATQRIRDELMKNKMHNVDNFEATIINVVKRMRGNRDEPGAIQKWTD